MLTTNAFAGIGALVGEPARAAMLVALMDGRALTATELAACANITAQTASSHLARLVDAGLLVVERQGRHRYHRLAGPAIARMVEGMMAVATDAAAVPARPVRIGPGDQALRHARTCYDHLAGRVAVAIADALLARGELEFGADGGVLTASGLALLRDAGVALAPEHGASGRRVFCRPCLDWSERRPHLAGQVGAALLAHFLARDWVRRKPASRVVSVTPTGQRHLAAMFGLDAATWDPAKGGHAAA